MGYFILKAVHLGQRGEVRCSGHLVVRVEFSKKKIAKGQTLHPNSNLYLEVQL